MTCRLEESGERLTDLLEIRAAKAAPQKFEPRTAQCGRRQRDRPSRALANLDKSNPRAGLSQALLRDCLKYQLRGLTPQVIEHDINPRLCNFAAKGRDHRRLILIERDDGISAERPHLLQRLGISAGGD